MVKENRKFDLEERLIEFSMMICDIVEKLPNTKVANHLSGQMLRSGTSPALNYGEALEAESRNDFVHKMSVCKKELRETKVALRMIKHRGYKEVEKEVEIALEENTELLKIFSASIKTAKANK